MVFLVQDALHFVYLRKFGARASELCQSGL
jgi:hypothetical protein